MCRDRRQTFPRHIIDDIEDPKAPAAGKLIVDEVEGPTGIGLGFDEDWGPHSHGTPPGAAPAHRQPFLAIEPVDPIDAGRLTLLPQSIAEPPTGIRQIAKPAP